MKKILSLTLAALMLVSMIPTAFAAETTDYTNGTAITLTGSQEESAGGSGDYYTVTVPAALTPGQTGTVTATGMWDSDKILSVSAPNTATLAYGAQTMDVGITFNKAVGDLYCGFSAIGSSTEEISVSYDLTVAEASTLFGTWTGILEYNVVLAEKGDVNQDGLINQADVELLNSYNSGSASISDAGMLVADVNGDGEISNADSTKLNAIVNANIPSPDLPSYTPADSTT